MKILGLVSAFLLTISGVVAQESEAQEVLISRKGQFHVYWGWNVSSYSNSDITFKGEDYNFTLDDVQAFDRPTPFNAHDYFNPAQITIPQFNFRLGYFFHENYNISVGFDHMKYVVKPFQIVNMNGEIQNSGTEYDGVYNNTDQPINKDFLRFEHTDGLNYVNLELRRFDEIYATKDITFNLTEGFGAGLLIPRTNTTLLGKERYDEVHVSGYGLAAMVGVNITFFERYFIQSELKGGYINMANIRTTQSELDKASQDFFFGQFNVVFGVNINTKRGKRMKAAKANQ